jgi:uncharacterized protein YukE
MGKTKRQGMMNFSSSKKALEENKNEEGELEIPDEVWVELSKAFHEKSFEKFRSALTSFSETLQENTKVMKDLAESMDSCSQQLKEVGERLKEVEERIKELEEGK